MCDLGLCDNSDNVISDSNMTYRDIDSKSCVI